MPIRPENRRRYPTDWELLSARIRFGRADSRCECRGECGASPHTRGRCDAVHGHPHPFTGSNVVLTVAHLNHTPEDCAETNLKAMCQRCHLNYDKDEHRAQAARTRAAAVAEDNDALFDIPEEMINASPEGTGRRTGREGRS